MSRSSNNRIFTGDLWGGTEATQKQKRGEIYLAALYNL
jgi:hypothetical protein